MNILIIEDNFDKLEILKELLTYYTEEEYWLEIRNRGINALKLLESKSFDYIFLDHHLPDCKGTELLSEIYRLQPNVCCISISNDSNLLANYRILGYHFLLKHPFSEQFTKIFSK